MWKDIVFKWVVEDTPGHDAQEFFDAVEVEDW